MLSESRDPSSATRIFLYIVPPFSVFCQIYSPPRLNGPDRLGIAAHEHIEDRVAVFFLLLKDATQPPRGLGVDPLDPDEVVFQVPYAAPLFVKVQTQVLPTVPPFFQTERDAGNRTSKKADSLFQPFG